MDLKNRFSILYGLLLVFALCASGCARQETRSLPDARRGFKTVLTPQAEEKEPVEPAPPAVFRTLKYPAPSGELAAYLSPNPGDGKKHPAIIWITGGDCNSIGDVWSPSGRENDQTAAAYRKAGIVMMFPSLRGGNDNPGAKEGFLGEVDDVIAATKFLEKQPYVDPQRIYLGGHSTGGTLVLLVAQSSPRYRGVFSLGPVHEVASYGADSGFLPFDSTNRKEVYLRSPAYWLHSVQSPVWIIEGGQQGNIEAVNYMKKVSKNPKAHFVEVSGADHFTVIAPTNELIAKKIVQDTGETSNIAITGDEITRRFAR